MNNNKNGGGIAVGLAIFAILGIAIVSSDNSKANNTSSSKPTTTTTPSVPSVPKEEPKEEPKIEVPETWKCYDATSYDRNPNNDNRCVSSKGTVRYVSDCEAVRLDPTYCPPQRGASYYNGCSCSAY